MERIMMRLAALVAAIMISMEILAKTQDVGGKVIDSTGQPLPFVNVVLLSLPDSAFVQGAVTDEEGTFKIATNLSKGILKLSCIGYETLYLDYKAANGLTIQMKEDTKILGEVVVKSQLPKTYLKGDAMRTTVEGTILEKAGTVSDALSKIPSLEAERDGAVKVIGRGDAEVYINRRRVLDIKELSRLIIVFPPHRKCLAVLCSRAWGCILSEAGDRCQCTFHQFKNLRDFVIFRRSGQFIASAAATRSCQQSAVYQLFADRFKVFFRYFLSGGNIFERHITAF